MKIFQRFHKYLNYVFKSSEKYIQMFINNVKSENEIKEKKIENCY